jgi:hypothetical protein
MVASSEIGPVPPVTIVSDGRCARAVVVGPLDTVTAAHLMQACEETQRTACSRLDVDLSDVTECTDDGVAAIAYCLAAGRHLTDGVGVTVASEAGRRALLDSMASV